MNLKPGIGAGKKARWEKSQSHRDFFCGSHVWSSWKMLLGRCHWSWSPCFNTGRSCDPFNILAHQVYSIQTVHFLLSNNTDFAFYLFISHCAEMAITVIPFTLLLDGPQAKAFTALYSQAITRNNCCFSEWLNTNKSGPLYFSLNTAIWMEARLCRQKSRLSWLVDLKLHSPASRPEVCPSQWNWLMVEVEFFRINKILFNCQISR